jgi:hypothetical protein
MAPSISENRDLAGGRITPESAPGIEREFPDQILPVPLEPWPEAGYKVWPHVKSGALLGMVAGCISLLANIVGSVFWPSISGQEQHPLRIIQVYLTFPLGESALQLNSGMLLALGCILFVVTGAFYGIMFEVLISYFLPGAKLGVKLAACTVLALSVWVANFYVVLSWLQPLVTGGNWIIDLIPWWVAALTHLIFGCAIALLSSGRFESQKTDR